MPRAPRRDELWARIRREGGDLVAETLGAYQRARLELLGRLVEAAEADGDPPLTIQHTAHVLREVEAKLASLYRELTPILGASLTQAARMGGQAALADLGQLNPATLARFTNPPELAQAFDVGRLVVAPRIDHDFVSYTIANAAEDIKGVNQTLRRAVRRELQQAVIQGASVREAAIGIMGRGLTLEGIRPVFPSIESRAEAIARTELSNAANGSLLSQYLEAAQDFPEMMLEWVDAACTHDCDLCHKRLAGMRVKPGELFRAGSVAKYHPPAHPRCKCHLVARLP